MRWLVTALAIGLSVSAADQSAAEEYPRLQIAYLSESVIEPTIQPEPNTTVTIKDDDVVFAANYGHAFVARVTSAGQFGYLGKEAKVDPGAILIPAEITGGDLTPFDRLAPAFCLDTKFDGSRGITTLFTLGLADATADLDRYTTFCVIDKDSDLSFETGVLVGIRKGELRKQFPIEPFTYEVINDYLKPDHSINLAYHVGTLFSKPRLTMLVGAQISSPVFKFNANNADGEWAEFKNEINFSPKNLPYTFDFLTMRFTLLSMSKKDKTAILRIERGFEPTPICRDCKR